MKGILIVILFLLIIGIVWGYNRYIKPKEKGEDNGHT